MTFRPAGMDKLMNTFWPNRRGAEQPSCMRWESDLCRYVRFELVGWSRRQCLCLKNNDNRHILHRKHNLGNLF